MNENGKLSGIFSTLSKHDLPVEAMDLEVSVRNALKRGGIHTLAQLLQLSHSELLRIFPNRKLSSYEDVIHHLVRLSGEREGMNASAPDFTSVKDISSTLGGGKISEKKFNIFQVAGIWQSEEIHTSVIAELINPNSAFHDKGAAFLSRFLRKTGAEISPEVLESAEVETEVLTDEGRRVDMVISTRSRCLPFEVKIWASDQNAQIEDYYKAAKKQAAKQGREVPVIYYLTPNGHEPGEQSRGDLSGDQVRCLSFSEDILPWLEDCMREPDIPSDVLEIMKQLRDNIQARPGVQGFSRWDVLDSIYRKLSQKYGLAWTECTAGYETFTLNKNEYGQESLEFALRVQKESGDLTRLYLICGLTRENGKPDYASAGEYISENAEKFNELLEATFKEGGKTLELKTRPLKNVWNRLPEKACYEKLDAEQCCREIENILKELRPGIGPARILER